MHESNVREIEEDLNIGPVLRSSKKKGEMSLRGQVEPGVLEMCTLQNKMVFFKARSKSMECCICSQYRENDGNP